MNLWKLFLVFVIVGNLICAVIGFARGEILIPTVNTVALILGIYGVVVDWKRYD